MMRLVLLLGCVLGCAGCGKNPSPPPAPIVTGEPPADNHDHDWQRPGSHDGLIVKISPNRYHAEVIFEKGGTVRLFPLGADWRESLAIDSQTLNLFAKPEGETGSSSLALAPSPQAGDPQGKTTQFVGKLPAELADRPVEVSGSILIQGERLRLAFTSHPHHDEEAMPAQRPDAEAQKLYLTPGGIYTEDDIRANGRQTAAQKYASFKATHDSHPVAGDRLCPVTQTKANPQCSWIIGGKTYTFCCPPCIDEFLDQAKKNPATIREPAAYLKK